MAFNSVAGYGNLPNGNFSPTIYSKKAQIAFRKSSTVQAITNNDYYGEISGFGDTVNVIVEPNITVAAYARGKQVTAQDLDDEQITLTVDQANYFAFKVDDIEERHSHVNWQALATDQAGYRLRDEFDSAVIQYMINQVPSGQTLGTSASPTAISFDGTDMTPLDVVNRMKRYLAVNSVPAEGRWLLADPYFYEKLEDEDSNLVNRDYADGNIIRNGKVSDGQVRGFTMYESNNVPQVGTGPEATSGQNHSWVLCGHMSSTATAEQINKTEKFRDPDSFADVCRGLHMYGRQVLRTEALAATPWQS